MPRFQAENFDANLKLVEKVKEWAAKKGCTPAQYVFWSLILYPPPMLVTLASSSDNCERFEVSIIYRSLMLDRFSINWLVALSNRPGMPKIIPIPGAGSLNRVKENIYEVKLTDEDMNEVDAFLKEFNVSGDRMPPVHAELLDTNDTTEVTA